MNRSTEEILDDVYYKGFIDRWLVLTDSMAPPEEISAEIGRFRDLQVRNDPDREERINECLDEMVKTIQDATKMLKVRGDAEDAKRLDESKLRRSKRKEKQKKDQK